MSIVKPNSLVSLLEVPRLNLYSISVKIVFPFFIIEKLRLLTHLVGNLSHKGIVRRALPVSGGKDAVVGRMLCYQLYAIYPAFYFHPVGRYANRANTLSYVPCTNSPLIDTIT